MTQIGLESDRIEMFHLSSAMGPQFAQYAAEMTERVQKLGPSPLREGQPSAATGRRKEGNVDD